LLLFRYSLSPETFEYTLVILVLGLEPYHSFNYIRRFGKHCSLHLKDGCL